MAAPTFRGPRRPLSDSQRRLLTELPVVAGGASLLLSLIVLLAYRKQLKRNRVPSAGAAPGRFFALLGVVLIGFGALASALMSC